MNNLTFSNPEVISLINDNFIAIKLDKDEAPHISSFYMNFYKVYNNRIPSWPLISLLTPELKPYFTEGYIEPQCDTNSLGLIHILREQINLWEHNQSVVKFRSQELFNITKAYMEKTLKEEIKDNSFNKVIKDLETNFNPQYGGFSKAPKFPTGFNLFSLIKISIIKDSHILLGMVEKTLISLYKGGIFDHIGYGFFRYSIDNKWLVPHFEKLLCDNTSLIFAYAEAFKLTKNSLYKDIAYKIISYLKENLKSKCGGYFAGESSFNVDGEGEYYLFSSEELNTILEEDSTLFSIYYDVTKEGNFKGKNILNIIDKDIDLNEFFEDKKEIIRKKLLAYRRKRPKPFLDSKIINSWNSLLAASFIYASKAFSDKELLDLGKELLDFNINQFLHNNQLYRVYLDDEVKIDGLLEDYSYFIFSLIEYFKVTKDTKYMELAINITEETIKLFYDNKNFAFFTDRISSTNLLINIKNFYDSSLPSGNSLMISNLIEIYKYTKNKEILKLCKNTINSIGGNINKTPTSYITMVLNALIMKNLK